MNWSDNTFDDADWTLDDSASSTLGSVTAAQQASGGNTGACRRVTSHLEAPEISAVGFHFKTAATYNPSTEGAIAKLSFSLDGCPISSTHPTGFGADGMGYAIALKQGGKNYFANVGTTGDDIGTWATYSAKGLTQDDFEWVGDPDDHPDFSVTGSEITFGFMTRNSSGFFEYDLTADWDNWQVSLNAETARVRGSVQEDVGSIFDSVEVKAVDSSVREEFFLDQELGEGSLANFREALRPTEDALRYYPLGQQTTDKLNAYSGETILSRMARTFPPPIMRRVEDIPELAASLVDSVKVSAQDALQYIFDQWSAHPTIGQWFTAEAVPDLRVRRSDQTYTGTNGVLYTETISIPQLQDRRLNMLDILQEWMSAFPGTVARVNSSGNLAIVPIVGPDAQATPIVTLGLEDTLSVSEGKPDPTGVVNRWTVSNTPITKQTDFPIMEPAWFQLMSLYHMNASGSRITAPGDRLDISGAEDFSEATRFNDNRPAFWPLGEGLIPGGEAVKLTDSGGTKQITVSWKDEDGSTGTIDPSDITVTDIPFDGSWVDAIKISRSACSGFDSLKVTLRARWVAGATRTGVEFALGSPMQTETCTWLNETTRRWVLGFTLSDASEAYAEDDAERKATFGIIENDDYLPSTSGANAIEESQNTHGVIEREQTIRVFELEPEQLIDIAMAGVLVNIDPKVVREVQQSTWRAFAVKQDHVGLLVQLPNGEQGIVVSRSYVDDFSAGSSGITIDSTLRVRITNAIVDSDTDFLFMDDDTYFQMDDGVPAVES